MQLEYRVLDVFTNTPLAGNPLGLFPDSAELSGETMQAIARELNLSETIFITKQINPQAWQARIFTPGAEMLFAGHPSIGCSWHLFHAAREPFSELELHLPGGGVLATLDGALEPALVAITPPPVTLEKTVDDPTLVASLLGIAREDLALDSAPSQVTAVGPRFLQVPLRSREALERCRPNLELLGQMEAEHGFSQLACFAIETYTAGATAAVRMFAPLLGVYEDPATGSNAACLATYLRAHGVVGDTGDGWLTLDQGYSIHRPSKLFIRANQSADGIAVQVGGQCVEVIRGTLNL
jgi:trans-2,3-dihydro-3-hydroxyanthranilate isomerase